MHPNSERALLLEISQALPVCPSGKNNMQMKMSMEHWWNDTDRETEGLGEKPAPQCYFVHYISHMNLHGIEPGSARCLETKNNLNYI